MAGGDDRARYEGKAIPYAQGRQGYAPEAFAWIASIVPPKGARVAEFGAGTGIASEMLLDRGYVVDAVERIYRANIPSN